MAYIPPGQYKIFTNRNFYHMADPQATWMFDIQFLCDNPCMDPSVLVNAITNGTLIATSVSLPTYKTDIVTRKYFGSERSYPVLRTYGGDCDINFDVRAESSENNEIDKIVQLSSRIRKDGSDMIAYHPEFTERSKDDNTANWTWRFDKILVNIRDKRGFNISKNGVVDDNQLIMAQYEYKNCVITNFAFNEGLDYASDTKLTCKLTFHYDIWSKLI